MERADELDIALLRQMEREILLDTVYDERRLSDADCFSRIEAIVKVYEAIGADGGARHDF